MPEAASAVQHHDLLGWTHLLAAVVAILAGAVVVFLRKGTRVHRRVGLVYVGAMLAVNVTALLIYELFGGFGPFHWAALLSLVTVIAGWLPARRRAGLSPRWLPRHAYWMCGSYVGLLAAAVSEVSTRHLETPFGPTVVAASLAVVAMGVALMWHHVPPLIGAARR